MSQARSETELCNRLWELFPGPSGVTRVSREDKSERVTILHARHLTGDGETLAITSMIEDELVGRGASVLNDTLILDTGISMVDGKPLSIGINYARSVNDRWSDEYNESIGFLASLVGMMEDAIANEHS